jgi:antitoxin ParD1/3/4
MATMNISLPDEMKAFIESQVATGMYANASDYVRDALRDGFRKRQALIAALEEGAASGISERSLDEIIEQEFAKFPSE